MRQIYKLHENNSSLNTSHVTTEKGVINLFAGVPNIGDWSFYLLYWTMFVLSSSVCPLANHTDTYCILSIRYAQLVMPYVCKQVLPPHLSTFNEHTSRLCVFPAVHTTTDSIRTQVGYSPHVHTTLHVHTRGLCIFFDVHKTHGVILTTEGWLVVWGSRPINCHGD